MPAIRFQFNGILSRATMPPDKDTGWVEIRMHNGRIQRFPWLGFTCKHGLNFMVEGAYAKMRATEVTDGDGFTHGEWLRLEDNQFVLCWRVPTTCLGKWGIFGIVDAKGWPIVMTDKTFKPPKKPSAKLYSIEKRMAAPGREDKRA